MMNISLQKAKAKECQTLVLLIPGEIKGSDLPFAKDALDLVEGAFADKSFKGAAKESLFFREANVAGHKHVLLLGAGDKKNLDGEAIRSLGGQALGQLKSQKVKSAVFDLRNLYPSLKAGTDLIGALAEGLWLADYSFEDLKNLKDKKKKKDELSEIVLIPFEESTADTESLKRARIVCDSVNFSRWLADHPGNLMTPKILADHAVKAAKGTRLKVTVWDGARIKKEKFGGLLGVSLGSDKDPRFIILEYAGAAKSKKPVCFVGKGLTFDSGGISIKPSAGMEEMKYDMCGGANVIGAMLAIARLGLQVNAIGLVPATENMPGPGANKPGDVLVARNGKTIEVLNTDAEGRIILADALSYASELKPAAIFDAATLTGAIVVSLSNIHTGVFTRDQKLWKKIEEASEATGELVWPMPLVDAHVEDVKGVHADWANISSYKGGGSSTAAAFLEQFVQEGIPWAHFDIAGTAWHVSNRLSYVPKKGASGVMVRTFIELAQKF